MMEIAALIVGLVALLGGLVGLAEASASLYYGIKAADKNDIKEMNETLDELKQGQTEILTELKEIIGEVEWSEIVDLIAPPVGRFEHFFEEYQTLIPPSTLTTDVEINKWKEAHKAQFDAWAIAILDESNGLYVQLGLVDSAFRGAVTRPLMQIVAQNVKSATLLTQSEYFIAALKLRQIQYYEGLAILGLAAAYKRNHPDATKQDVDTYLKPQYEMLKNQITVSKPFLDELDRYRHMASSPEIYLTPITWTSNQYLVYIDQHEVTADDGWAVVALNFYKKGEQLALSIWQAQLTRTGDIVLNTGKKKQNDMTDGTPFRYGKNETVTLMSTKVPDPTVTAPDLNMVTGVKLVKTDRGQLMVALQYAPFDLTKGALDVTKRAWTQPDAAIETQPFTTRGFNFVGKWTTSLPDGSVPDIGTGHTNGVGFVAFATEGFKLPDPLSPIVGIKLAAEREMGELTIYARTDFYRA